jgi:hypothetical protein
MPVEMIELEVVEMMEETDEALEASVGSGIKSSYQSFCISSC